VSILPHTYPNNTYLHNLHRNIHFRCPIAHLQKVCISHAFYAAEFVGTARPPAAYSRTDSECHTNTTVHISYSQRDFLNLFMILMPACHVHCALWLSAQRCTKMLIHHAHFHCSTTRVSAKMLFTTLTALHDVYRVAPLRTTASTNHRAP